MASKYGEWGEPEEVAPVVRGVAGLEFEAQSAKGDELEGEEAAQP